MNKLLKNSTFQIFLAMILGMVAGAIVPNIMVSTKFVGDIFLRLIQMSVVVLVMGSVIEAVGSLKRKEIGALGGKAFIGFACTTLVAGTVGIIGANLVKPGSGIEYTGELTTEITGSEQTLTEIITNFFPSNIVSSIAEGNTIQVIVFALLAGLAISLLSESIGSSKILDGVRAINQVLLTIIKLVMKVAPLGIFSLLGWAIGNYGLALYLALACLTVAQFFGVEMTLQQQFVVVIMSTLATLGTVVVPGGGLVALAIVLPTIGLPIEGVALLSGIDWFSGMFRTTLNVIDDVLVALVVAKQEGEFDRQIFDRD